MSADRLILASASPRRRELLTRLLPAFDVQECPLSEPRWRSARVTPRKWAQALAYFKARSVSERHPERWVLAADTIVACDGHMLGKPRDREDARRMLELQARQVSEVVTGVSLLRVGPPRRQIQRVDVTRVWMRDDPVARQAYLASGDWAGKAGAYGIQDVGDRLVERIEGSFSNVVGLPLELVRRMLAMAGLPVSGR